MKTNLLCVVLIPLLFSACVNSELLLPDGLINQTEEGCDAISYVDLVSEKGVVGKLQIKLMNDTIRFDFITDSEIYIKELKYHLTTKIEEMPQLNGIPQTNQFKYSADARKILLPYITQSSNYSGPIYIAAFVKFGYQPNPVKQMYFADVERTHDLTDISYFKVSVTDTVIDFTNDYKSFCFQGDQAMDATKDHWVKLLSSYSSDSTLLNGIIDSPEHLDLLNWIINQDPSRWKREDGSVANAADIQMAFWKIIEKTGHPTGAYILNNFDSTAMNSIVHDALENGDGFKPMCGQKKFVIMHKGMIGAKNPNTNLYNTGSYANPNFQVNGLIQEVICSPEYFTAWAKGYSFPGEPSAMFFGICVDQ